MGSTTLALRSAGAASRTQTFSAVRWAQRPSLFKSRIAVQTWGNNLRNASSESTTSAATEAVKVAPKKAPSGPKKAAIGTSLALVLFAGVVYVTDTRASFHRYVSVPLIRILYPDAEDAHHVAVDGLKTLYKFGLHPRERGDQDGDCLLVTEVFGQNVANPIGIAAGLDKDAEIPDPLFEIGSAIVEVGGITPLPQEGNPKPRVFRVPSQEALINRYGLNSKGADHVAAVLKQRVRDFAYAKGFGWHDLAEKRVLDGEAGVPPGSLLPGKLLAVQVAKNKATPDSDIEAIKRDYVYCVDRLAKYADILVVNVSSPNTAGLRDLQASAPLTAILKAVVGAANRADRKTKPAVMVKVSPDEDSDEQITGICEAVWKSGVDGVIVGNTTKSRPGPDPKGYALTSKEQETMKETGGYSGPRLFDHTVSLVARYRALLNAPPITEKPEMTTPEQNSGDIQPAEQEPAVEKPSPKVIFACGGITNGKQALAALNAGASVAMLYTGIVYGGVGIVTRIKKEMRELKRQSE